jgi:hypothetical protein
MCTELAKFQIFRAAFPKVGAPMGKKLSSHAAKNGMTSNKQ